MFFSECLIACRGQWWTVCAAWCSRQLRCNAAEYSIFEWTWHGTYNSHRVCV